MTEAEKLAMLKVLVNSRFSSEDAMLTSYLALAADKILNKAYPYETVTEVPARYHYLQVEIAAYMVDKKGADYQTSHSENGITRTYESPDVPPSMLKSIIPHCGAIGHAIDNDD